MISNTHRISLIIPLRLTAATYQGVERLRRICASIPRNLYEIIISDYGTEEKYRQPLTMLEADDIRVLRHPAPHNIFSIGQCRDFAVQMASCPVIMFHDLDFLADREMYQKIYSEVVARGMATNVFDFFCVPVLFLTEAGTDLYFAQAALERPLLPDNSIQAIELASHIVQAAAFGSSAIVANRHHYLASGGHNARFHGHGAEDYELLHRLASLAPKGPWPHEYLTDFKTNTVRKYWGFRAFFALYGLEAYHQSLHLVHLWHPRRQEKGYFRARRNFSILKQAMRHFDKTGRQPDPLPDLLKPSHIVIFCQGRDEAFAVSRQILPWFGGYSILPQWQTSAKDMLEMAVEARAGHVLALSVASDLRASAQDFWEAGIRLVIMEESSGEILFRDLTAPFYEPAFETEPGRGTPQSLQTRLGASVKGYFKEVDFPGGLHLESGTVPEPHAATSLIFSNFGGVNALKKGWWNRPRRKKKTSLWVRFKRFISGY